MVRGPGLYGNEVRYSCAECGRTFVDGKTGEYRRSGGRCFKCLKGIFGDQYEIPHQGEVYRRLRLADRARKYGVTLVDLERMLADQGDACAICRKRPADSHELVVDHDHETGAVRALLCGRCNTAIGMFKEDPQAMRAAASYVESHACNSTGNPLGLPPTV